MRISRILSGVGLGACLLLSNSCSSSGGGSSVTLKVLGAAANREIMAALEPIYSALDPSRIMSFGMNTTAQMESLRYIIGEIAVCETVTTQGGFGFSNQSNCASLYSKTMPFYGLGDLSVSVTLAETQAAAAAGNQVDFATTAGRAALSSSKTIAAGTYNYAIVNWYPGIQVRTSVTTAGATVMTKSGGTVAGATGPVTTVTSDMSTGLPEDAFVVSANGGASFRFASPFVVDGTTAYNLDMTFNPQQVVSAKDGGTGGNLQDGANHGMYVPMLTLLPVPHAADATTKRETYLVDTGTDNKIRIELYYASTDITKIYGVSAYLVFDNTAATPAFGNNDTCRVTDVTVNANGTVKLVNNQFGTVADGLTRAANGNVSTATPGGCGGTSASLPYTYVGTDTVM